MHRHWCCARRREFHTGAYRCRAPRSQGIEGAIVGGTGGIGRTFSRLLASRGIGVLIVGQNFRDADLPGIEFIKADLSLMREAQRAAWLGPRL
jgi:hypothetical protein